MIFFARKRLIALMIACLMLCSSLAACAETAMVMSSAVVYASAKTSSKALGKLKAGTMLVLVAEKSGWAKVELNGNVGFMKASALGVYETYDDMPAYTTKSTAMYKSYSTSSKKLGTIPGGEKVEVTATAGQWARVSYKGYTGFVALSNLTKNAPAKAPEKTFDSYTAYAKVDGAKVYNANGKVTGTVAINTQVTVTAEKGDVCQVKRSGKTAYMMKSQLSTSKVEVQEEKPASDIVEISPITFYVKNDGAKVYNTSGKVIGSFELNTAVTVSAYRGDLALISKSGKTGVMYKKDLSSDKIEEEKNDIVEISPTTFYVKNDGAKVIDADGDTIAKLSVNTAVTVTAYNGDYALVTNGSTAGLMKKDDLSATKIETENNLVLEYGDKGDAVKKVQTRLKELGFFSGTIGGNYLDLTKAAVASFQAAAGLTTTGVCDENTLSVLFSDKAPKKEAAPEKDEGGSSNAGYSTATPARGTAKAMDWWTSGIQSIFSVGTTATITDVSTGIAWYTKRSGGTNHADVQPLTAADTNSMKKAVGSWSWTRRAIFVTINGVNYAASMNCMPHGSGSITNNNFSGHHCIHFTNSRTHGSNSICSLHQAAIKKAANASL
ncbi:MAG: SH3 domain-containing protein [Clostridia bacterium]|nr:SH3 domain-containing protein [Clostridia bacterium]